jgi:hypothetical protein
MISRKCYEIPEFLPHMIILNVLLEGKLTNDLIERAFNPNHLFLLES